MRSLKFLTIFTAVFGLFFSTLASARTISKPAITVNVRGDTTVEVIHGLLPNLREEYLRNRFRNYMNRFQLYNADDTKFELNIELVDKNVNVTEAL